MKPESADFLLKARSCLAGAKQIAGLPLPHIVAREAYLAAFHAAEAYVYERTGRATKTHRGLRATFSRLAKDDPDIDVSLLKFLAEGYAFKSIADYGVGSTTQAISPADAEAAITAAELFVENIARLLPP